MNLFTLAIALLRRRWGQALSTVLAGSLSIAMVQMVMIAEREVPKASTQAFGGVDLVVGPRGSALDLVLCCVLHVSEPRGLVPLQAVTEEMSSPLIKAKAPIALGDNYRGVRIVGTTSDIVSIYGATLADGAMWTEPSQAVMGAQAARVLGLKVGDSFVGSHGLAEGGEEHSEFPYRVTGILAPTGSGLDRLILTSIETVWTIHHHHEIDDAHERGLPPPPELPPTATAMVASFKSPVAMASVPRQIDAGEHFSAAVPAFEAARLVRAGRPVIQMLLGIGLLFAVVAALSAMAVLATAMAARVRDLALLRVLGAHPWELALLAKIEALLLAGLAMAIGEALVLAAAPALMTLAAREGLVMTVLPTVQDIKSIGIGVLLSSLTVAVVPALRAMKAPFEKVLSP